MSTSIPAAHVAENRAREEIARIGADLYARRYTVGSAGNISARLDDGCSSGRPMHASAISIPPPLRRSTAADSG